MTAQAMTIVDFVHEITEVDGTRLEATRGETPDLLPADVRDLPVVCCIAPPAGGLLCVADRVRGLERLTAREEKEMAEKLRKRILEIQERLNTQPEKAMVSITAASRAVDGENWRSEVKVRDHIVTMDLPANFAGTDRGPKPTEFLLVALATCHEVTYRVVAESLGIPLNGVSVTVTGVSDGRGFIGLDHRFRPGFLEMRGEVTLDTPASDDDVERLRQMVEKHCPVLDDLRAPVPVTMGVVIARRAAKSTVG